MARQALERAVGLLFGLSVAVAGLSGCSGGGSSGGAPSSGSVSAGSTTGLSLGTGRAYHTATLLPTGEVFVAGGIDATGHALQNTALVTPDAVRDGPPLLTGRYHHTATLLENGQVLLTSGQVDNMGSPPLSSTEIYDPIARTVIQGPALATARTQAVAVGFGPAGSQLVMVAGGSNGTSPLASVEIFDPKKRAFTPTKATLAEPHSNAGAALFDNGTVLIVGGDGAKGPAGAEIFDPSQGTFTPTTITVKRTGGAFAATQNEAFVGGGESSTGIERSTERYDEATAIFSQGTSLLNARRDATASVSSSSILVIGGRNSLTPVGKIEVLQGQTVATATVAAVSSLATARYAHTSTTIQSGHVIVIGGYDASGVALASIEDVDPAAAQPLRTTAPGPVASTPAPAPIAPPPPPPAPPPVDTSSSSGSGGLGGLLSGLLGGLTGGSSSSGSHGTIWGHLAKAFVDTLVTTGFSDGFGTFLSALFKNLIAEFLGSGSGPPSGIGDLLGSLFGGGSSSSSSSSSGSSSGGFLSGLLGSLFGGSSSSSSSGSSGSGLGGILSGLLGSLFGGSSSSSSSSSSGTSSSGSGLGGILSGLLGSLFGGGSSSSSSSTPSSTSTAPDPSASSSTSTTPTDPSASSSTSSSSSSTSSSSSSSSSGGILGFFSGLFHSIFG